MTQMKMQKLVAAISVGLACSALSSAALATHSWGGYHWTRTANPFAL